MFRARTLVIVAAALATLGTAAGCTKDSQATSRGAAPSGDAAARLERLEKRLARIEEVLGPRLGPPEPDPGSVYSVKVEPWDPVEGPADAKVTVIEGYEFACPYCLKAEPIVKQLREAFPNDVRVVAKYLVVHEQAVPAGLAACAANQQGKYTEMKDLLWTKAWGPDGRPIMEELSPQAMEANATALGLDLDKFRADMNGESCRNWLIESQKALAAVGQTGTPGFYINGRPLGGLVPLDAMKKVVAEELEKANAAIAAGTKQEDYYRVAVVEKGLKEVQGWFEDGGAEAAE